MLKRYPVVILILFLAIGYAGISSVHIINGNVDIGYDDTFGVIFYDVATYDGNSLINNNRLDFKTKTLKSVGDTALLEFDVLNNSLNYDANVVVNCTLKSTSSSLSQYLDIGTSFANPTRIDSGKLVTATLTIKIKKTNSSGITPEFMCTIVTSPIEREKVGEKYTSPHTETALQGTDPVLDGSKKLIPVKLSMDGTVKYADTTKRWYSYENKEWANAVILVDSPSKTYKAGDIIKESDIESYFVWIPRYRYQIFDTGNYSSIINSALPTESKAQEIQIIFESKEKSVAKGTTKGSWLTHPAFTNYNTNGIWVGKFETGYAGATNAASAQVNANAASKVIIKPNVYSWRSITVSNMFKTALSYENSLNSHMMRNTEWGAVAYLSHSKYGINDEVRINNNSNFLTGYAANEKDATSSTTNNSKYNTEIGYLASTTGNITGVYDMSGGAWDYVAGYISGNQKNAGFSASELTTYANHFDVYNASSGEPTYYYRILGDATGEMGPFYNYKNNWYADGSAFVCSVHPWFLRGGYHADGTGAGQFYFGRGIGGTDSLRTFRITLAF